MAIHFKIIFRHCVNKVYLLRNIRKDLCTILQHATQQIKVHISSCYNLLDIGHCCCLKFLRTHFVYICAIDCTKLCTIKNCRGFADPTDRKNFFQFIQRIDFLFPGGCPTKKCNKVYHCLWQIALFHQILERSVTVSLRKLMGLIFHNRCTVNISRNFPAKCLVQQIILRSRRQILIATNHMGNSHQMIVYYICEIIGRHSVCLNQNLIIQRAVLYGNITIDFIVKCRCTIQRHFLTNDIRHTGIQFFLYLFRCQIATMTVVHRCNPGCLLNFPHLVQTFFVAETVICMTGFYQFFCIGLKHSHSFRLNIRSYRSANIRTLIPSKPCKLQGVINYIHCTLYITLLVCIFNSQNKVPVIFFCNQISVQCSTQIPDMHITGRTWCKSGSYFFTHSSVYSFLRQYNVPFSTNDKLPDPWQSAHKALLLSQIAVPVGENGAKKPCKSVYINRR